MLLTEIVKSNIPENSLFYSWVQAVDLSSCALLYDQQVVQLSEWELRYGGAD